MKLKPDTNLLFGCLLVSVASNAVAAAEKPKAEEESPVTVQVVGTTNTELADNLQAYLPPRQPLRCDSPQERLERYIDSARPKLTEAAEAMGYFSSEIDMTASRAANCWQLTVNILPGEPVKVAKTIIKITGDGASIEPFTELKTFQLYENNEVLVTQKYEDFKTLLTRSARRFGFFDAKFVERQIEVNIDTRQAVVNLHFETGKRYEFGQVAVEQEVLDPKYLNRYLRVQPGQAYSSDDLLAQQRILENSGYYRDVQIVSNYQALDNSGQVPVTITTQRNKRYAYNAEVAYSSDDGFVIETGMEARWVNRRGHKLEGALMLTQTDYYKAGFKYIVPLWKPEHEFASLSGSWIHSNDDVNFGDFVYNSTLDERKLELSYNRRNSNDWQQTAFISFFNEDFTLDIDGDKLTDRNNLTLMGARVSKTERDDPLFPTQGWRASAQIQGAHKSILSDQTLLQARADVKYLHSFDEKGKVITRATVGSTWIDNESTLPTSLGFTTGGQDSVRGFDANMIGELDEFGKVIGGKNLLVGSLEYEYPFTEKISAAVFADVGAAFNDWDDYDERIGMGLGARYKSPLGPVRLDLAVPKEDTKDLHFYFSLGPDL